MKLILLFIATFLTFSGIKAQYIIDPGELDAGEYTDETEPGWNQTTVTGATWRRDENGGVIYNHIHPIFTVEGAWLTQFNDGPVPFVFARVGDNVDYFQFQGDNKIEGDS